MAETGDNTGLRTVEAYDQFITDLKEQPVKILEDSAIKERIRLLKNPNASDEAKRQARTEITNSSLRLIPFAIAKFGPRSIPPEDLVGEAFEVINNCIDACDPDYISPKTEEPVKFSSYVMASLEKHLKGPRTYVDPQKPVHLPARADLYANIIRKAWGKFTQEHHREPTAQEWYKETVKYIGESGMALDTLKRMTLETFAGIKTHAIDKPYVRTGKAIGRGYVHTDTLRPKEGDIEDTLADGHISVEEAAVADELTERVREVLQLLTDKERKVLGMRFGLGSYDEARTLDEVAREIGVSRERVRQIEGKALRKLRHPTRAKLLRDFLEIAA